MKMARKEVVNNSYAIIYGQNKSHYDGFVDMHTHLRGDTANRPGTILRTAKARGLTGIVVTDHDRMRHIPRLQELNEGLGLGLDIIPGVESTAVVEKKGEKRNRHPKHVLVYLDPKDPLQEEIPCYMPVSALNEYVHTRGGRTAVAHPFLWYTNSLMEAEIRDVQNTGDAAKRFDFVEAHHGGVINLLNFAASHPRLTARLIRLGLMPPIVDTNEAVQNLFQQRQTELGLQGITSGSDAHSTEHIGDVGVRYDRSVGLIPSIVSGDYAVVQRKHFRPPSTRREEILGTLGGWRMEIERRHGKNGFVVYDRVLHGKLA